MRLGEQSHSHPRQFSSLDGFGGPAALPFEAIDAEAAERGAQHRLAGLGVSQHDRSAGRIQEIARGTAEGRRSAFPPQQRRAGSVWSSSATGSRRLTPRHILEYIRNIPAEYSEHGGCPRLRLQHRAPLDGESLGDLALGQPEPTAPCREVGAGQRREGFASRRSGQRCRGPEDGSGSGLGRGCRQPRGERALVPSVPHAANSRAAEGARGRKVLPDGDALGSAPRCHRLRRSGGRCDLRRSDGRGRSHRSRLGWHHRRGGQWSDWRRDGARPARRWERVRPKKDRSG